MHYISAILLTGLILENFIELVIKPILKKHKQINYDYVSSFFGVIFAWIFRLDIFSEMRYFETYNPSEYAQIVSVIITGLIIGRGSNIISKFLKLMDNKKI